MRPPARRRCPRRPAGAALFDTRQQSLSRAGRPPGRPFRVGFRHDLSRAPRRRRPRLVLGRRVAVRAEVPPGDCPEGGHARHFPGSAALVLHPRREHPERLELLRARRDHRPRALRRLERRERRVAAGDERRTGRAARSCRFRTGNGRARARRDRAPPRRTRPRPAAAPARWRACPRSGGGGAGSREPAAPPRRRRPPPGRRPPARSRARPRAGPRPPWERGADREARCDEVEIEHPATMGRRSGRPARARRRTGPRSAARAGGRPSARPRPRAAAPRRVDARASRSARRGCSSRPEPDPVAGPARRPNASSARRTSSPPRRISTSSAVASGGRRDVVDQLELVGAGARDGASPRPPRQEADGAREPSSRAPFFRRAASASATRSPRAGAVPSGRVGGSPPSSRWRLLGERLPELAANRLRLEEAADLLGEDAQQLVLRGLRPAGR